MQIARTLVKTQKSQSIRGFSTFGYTNQALIEKDHKYCAQNYKPLPVVISKG